MAEKVNRQRTDTRHGGGNQLAKFRWDMEFVHAKGKRTRGWAENETSTIARV